jgi:hypothetical protein
LYTAQEKLASYFRVEVAGYYVAYLKAGTLSQLPLGRTEENHDMSI